MCLITLVLCLMLLPSCVKHLFLSHALVLRVTLCVSDPLVLCLLLSFLCLTPLCCTQCSCVVSDALVLYPILLFWCRMPFCCVSCSCVVYNALVFVLCCAHCSCVVSNTLVFVSDTLALCPMLLLLCRMPLVVVPSRSYNSAMLRALNILVEASTFKHPPQVTI